MFKVIRDLILEANMVADEKLRREEDLKKKKDQDRR
tara:strand:- start:781 stop:888 length:108 start_codon:yes stop_codon:yes gene_type:complete